jgi:hypothetical protein
LARQAKEMIWQDLNLKRYFVLVCQSYQESHVRLKDFLLIVLTSMDFKSINADFMVDKIQTSMALEIEQTEEGITSQVIQMRRRLKALQV